jgi:8-oxo-dGTP pyrophosphatase MutT (NUDIX family)
MQKKKKNWPKINFYAVGLSLALFFGSEEIKASDDQDFSRSRAGVVLLKKYSEGDWAVLFGEKADTTQEWKSINFPAGQYDLKDQNSLEKTAIREMIEETGGQYSPLISVTPDSFYKTWSTFNSGKQVPPYLDHSNINGHIRLYFLDVTSIAGVGIDSLSQAVKSAIKDPNVPGDCKEVSNYWAVPVKDVYGAALTVHTERKNSAENRRVKSRSSQQKLQMISYYMAPMSGKIGEFRKILTDITGQDPQLGNVVSNSFRTDVISASMPSTRTITASSTSQPVLMGSFCGEPESVIRETIRNLESCSDNELLSDEINALKSFLPNKSVLQSVPTTTLTPVVRTNAPVLPVVVLSPIEQEIADLKKGLQTRVALRRIKELEAQLPGK